MANWMSLRHFAFLSLITVIILITSLPARGEETVILNIVLNGENQGEFYLVMKTDGDFYIRSEDLKKIGFKEIEGDVYEIGGEPYVLLGTIRGISFVLNEPKLSLEITAMPFHFERQEIDMEPRRPENVIYPSDTSAFLNYNLEYSRESSSRIVDLTNEAGIRKGNLLFLTDTNFTDTDTDSSFVRLMSSATYDRRPELQRIVVGDFLAPASILGSGLNMGGFRFYKAYDTAPDLITHPLINLTAAAALPSQVDIYLDGRLIHSEKVHPGDFDLVNFFPREGSGLMEVVIKDPFGREERLQVPFYLTTALLKKGYQDYSYSVGYLREQFGIRSFDYGKAAFSGYHFYGVNDHFTTGLNADISGVKFNFGPVETLRLWNAGVLALAFSTSRNDDHDYGFAESAGYSFQARKFNFQWALRAFTRNYTTLVQTSSEAGTQFDSLAGFGYNTETLGSFGLGYGINKKFEDSIGRIVTARYSRTVFPQVRMVTLMRITYGEDTSHEYFVSFIYSPTRKTTVSMNYARENDASTETVQIQNDPPFGEGFGGRATFQRTDSNEQDSNVFEGFLQYNAPYGTYIGRLRTDGNDPTYQFSAGGGLAYVGHTLSFGRPVTDSFAVVEVGHLKDVRVYVNNNEIGRTNSEGRLFVPDLASYYNNQISINDHDIPIDYTFPDVKQYLSPPGRSGSRIQFEASKYRAVFGKLLVRTATGNQLLKLYEISMEVEGKPLTFQTTGDGEFYVENVYTGSYKATVIFDQKPCTFDLTVPETEESLVDLGDLICETSD